MRRCWAGAAEARPSAAALVSLAAAPECAALVDAALVRCAATAAATPLRAAPGTHARARTCTRRHGRAPTECVSLCVRRGRRQRVGGVVRRGGARAAARALRDALHLHAPPLAADTGRYVCAHTLTRTRTHAHTHTRHGDSTVSCCRAEKAEPVLVSAICRVGATMWVGDSAGRLLLYS